ncbi:mucin-5AC [Atheta coriaria]|uniref:mucin-5AC n=1 Tax=Dalotia coriaria TaxID=877792 RepID=UPI0031F3E199
MADRKILILFATLSLALSLTNGEVQLITKPEPGQEYVFLQTSAAGSRPVERKEKPSENERVFETAHKLPPSLTFALNQAQAEEGEILKEPKGPIKTSKSSKPKREAAASAADAPAGAIKLDVQALLAKYKTELQTSTTAKPSSTTTKKTSTRSTRKPRLNPILPNKRSKKEAHDESVVPTTASSVLTTSAAGLKPIERDDDVPLVASGSEKQRSRIQIKKGPNGQEYEYEYVYYYYDDDDPKQTNAHDGPARNEVTPQNTPSRGGSRGETKAAVTPEPASNEVLPTSRGSRTRGRQLEDEDVADERLPANTRFPPRSRNLNTTPSVVEEVVEEVKPRGRGRGRPEAQAAATSAENTSDSVSDETQGSRGRTRANVRRPSLELVDSASFNTHTSSGEPPNGSGPTFPADLPAGPVRFLGATPNERMDLQDKKEASGESEVAPAAPAAVATEEATTMMSAMDKVALDLYAILQGTQRLSGEESEGNTEMNTEADAETTTLEATTEVPTTEAAPSTTTTTTTTTTQAPSSAAPENVFGRGKYRTRPAIGGRKPVSTSTTTEAPASSDGKPKSRFGRPSFGSRPRARPAATATEGETEQKETKEEAKPVSATRSRTRFGAGRTRVTTVAPEGTNEAKSPATPTKASSLRPRPTFNLRGRTRPTPAPEAESAPTEEGQEASTTTRSRPKLNGSNVRPLRPGPRINLTGGRGRLGVTTAAPAENPAEPAPVVEEDQEKTHAEEGETKEAEVTPAPDSNPLSRLRNRQRTPLQVRPAAPKAAASAPVQVRRANPLISRRKPIGEASTTEAAAPAEASTEASSSDAEEGATDAAASSTTSTTEEPKGLNKLLAGRRRLTLRQPGTVA